MFQRLLAVDPLTALNHAMPGYIHATLGEYQEALQHYQRAYEMEPDNPLIVIAYCLVSGRILPPEKIISILKKLEPLAPHHTFGRVAQFYRLAIEWLGNTLKLGYFNYPFFAKFDPFFNNLKEEKAFQELMKIAERKWEQFEIYFNFPIIRE